MTNQWEELFSSGEYGRLNDRSKFNEAYWAVAFGPPSGAASPKPILPIIKRECTGCADTHKEIYFKRKTNAKIFDAYEYLIRHWKATDNIHHEDFDIYSTLEDAISDSNPWSQCEFGSAGTGFPGECGPTELIES